MRKEFAAAGRLEFDVSLKRALVDLKRDKVGGAGEMQARRFENLIAGRQMQIAVAPVDVAKGNESGAARRLPVGGGDQAVQADGIGAHRSER